MLGLCWALGWEGSGRGARVLKTKRGEGFGLPMLPNAIFFRFFEFFAVMLGLCWVLSEAGMGL